METGLFIPIDVAELVVDEVAQHKHHISTMKTCALISRSFLERSRSYIFRTVHLTFQWGENSNAKYQRFRQVLKASPHLAFYVQQLYVDDQSRNVKSFIMQRSFPDVMRMFKNLKVLHLSFGNGRPFPHGVTDWVKLPLYLKEGLSRVLALPSLEEIGIKGLFDLPYQYMIGIARKRSLVICMSTISEPTYDDNQRQYHARYSEATGLKAISISDLNFGGMIPFVDFISETPIALEYLCYVDGELDVALEIIKAQKISLRELKILNNFSKHSASYIYLRGMRMLQKITICSGFESQFGNLRTFRNVTLGVCAPNNIQELVIELSLVGVYKLEADRWLEIDQTLSDEKFQSLKAVHLIVVPLDGYLVPKVEEERSLIRSLLPCLQEKGILYVDNMMY